MLKDGRLSAAACSTMLRGDGMGLYYGAERWCCLLETASSKPCWSKKAVEVAATG